MREEKIQQALGIWEELHQSPNNILAFESRLKYILDEEGKLDDVKYKAEKKGLEKGLEQGKQEREEEFVQNLLKMNFEMDVIQKATGLSVDQIEKIIEKLENP
ncbi:hypothetical protein [Psychrobacillus sp. L4]|uniref:hypothetical protein n=1 Tax=Psychrobacillus sp. L4 TaxID=3236892 RepID=UPI0036F4197E